MLKNSVIVAICSVEVEIFCLFCLHIIGRRGSQITHRNYDIHLQYRGTQIACSNYLNITDTRNVALKE
jgi:hypothetical protein